MRRLGRDVITCVKCDARADAKVMFTLLEFHLGELPDSDDDWTLCSLDCANALREEKEKACTDRDHDYVVWSHAQQQVV